MADALTRFHNRYAGASHEVFGRATRDDGRSSYAWLADHAPPGRILDLACGDGALAEQVVVRGRAVEGLDRNAAELACARERLPGVALHEGDARDLPFPDGSFDGVLSHMALMLIPDGDRVAAEIRRVCQPGGTVAGVVGDGLDRENPLVMDVMPAMHTVLDEADLRIDYPHERWTVEDLARRFPGAAIAEERFRIEQAVPLESFDRFLGLHFYGFGLLEGAFRETADAIARDIGARHAVDGAVRWSGLVRGFTAVLP